MSLKNIFVILFGIINILFLEKLLYAQNLKCFTFNNEDGLASNIVKRAAQDSEGFIWAATDAGLIRYDGKKFTSYSQNFPSLYVKDIRFTFDKQMLIVTDLGVGLIRENESQYEYISLVKGDSFETDSSLLYPKSIYIDRNNNKWIGERDNISRISGNTIIKYYFEEKNFSDSYNRSYQFAEDHYGNLFVVSWTGFIFRYDRNLDKFHELPFTPPASFYINQVQIQPDNSIWAATSDGLIRFEISRDFQKIFREQLLSGYIVSSFLVKENGDVYVGTWYNGIYLWKRNKDSVIQIAELPFRSINDISKDREGSIWISSDDGLGLIKEAYFSKAEYSSGLQGNTIYIINVVSDEKGIIYFSNQEDIYKIKKTNNNYIYEKIIASRNKRIYSFDVLNDKLWVSYRNGEYELYNLVNRQRIFKGSTGRINTFKISRNDFVWGYNEESHQIVKISPDFNFKYYSFQGSVPDQIRIIKPDESGSVYFAGNGNNAFFFKYNHETDKIENLSRLFSTFLKTEIIIYDLLVESNNNILIASNIGLFKYSGNNVTEAEDINISESVMIKALNSDERGRLWLGSERGLILYHNNQFTTYYIQDGLPNSTITERAIALIKITTSGLEPQAVWLTGRKMTIIFRLHQLLYLQQPGSQG